VTAFAPPGVGLTEAPDSADALLWRHAVWNAPETFQAGLLPDRFDTAVVGTIEDVVVLVPEGWHWWLADRAREHAIAVEDGARLLAADRPQSSQSLFDEALTEMTTIERVRSSALPAGGEHDQLRAEVLALMRLVREAADGPGVRRDAEFKELEKRLTRLVRDHRYVTSSVSWKVTLPLRTVRRVYLACRERGAALRARVARA
jgi:hypothetical protein